MQFPVSSGQHHRLNESEWVPVVPSKPVKGKEGQEQSSAETAVTSKSATAAAVTTTHSKPIEDDVPKPTAGNLN